MSRLSREVCSRGYYYDQVKEAIRRARKIVKIHKLINFGCDFVDGKCMAARKKLTRFTSPSESIVKCGCCCSDCVRDLGYLHGIPKEHFDRYKKCWDRKTGFYRERKGCILPLTLRSITCLTFVCVKAKDAMSKIDKKRVREMDKIRFED